MKTQMLNSPALHHPVAPPAPGSSRGPTIFDDSWGAVVQGRMAVRLEEAHEERLAHLASPDGHGLPIRARVGRVLIVLGAVIAGAAVDSGTAGRTL